MHGFQIRHVTSDDAEQLARLFRQLGHETSDAQINRNWRRWSHSSDAAFACVTDDRPDTLLGAITVTQMNVLHRPYPVGRITLLVVDQPYRGRGIGKALVDAAERHLKGAGCGILEVTSNLRLEDAHTFYQYLGFRETSLRFAKHI